MEWVTKSNAHNKLTKKNSAMNQQRQGERVKWSKNGGPEAICIYFFIRHKIQWHFFFFIASKYNDKKLEFAHYESGLFCARIN